MQANYIFSLANIAALIASPQTFSANLPVKTLLRRIDSHLFYSSDVQPLLSWAAVSFSGIGCKRTLTKADVDPSRLLVAEKRLTADSSSTHELPDNNTA